MGAPMPGMARGLPSLTEEAFDEEERAGVPGAETTLPSFPSLDCAADLESFALDKPRPTALPDVDTAGEPCREDDGCVAF